MFGGCKCSERLSGRFFYVSMPMPEETKVVCAMFTSDGNPFGLLLFSEILRRELPIALLENASVPVFRSQTHPVLRPAF